MPEAQYSISDLEHLSGIKAHTIRIWEKRYNILKPKRTGTNIRYYTNQDLKLVLNISFLNRNGVKISHIAAMSYEEITEKVRSFNLIRTDNPDLINNLVISLIDLNEAEFEKIYNSAIFRLGFEKTIIEVIFPFLRHTGIMWQTGSINPAQEHFISNLVRQKLIVAMDGIKNANSENAKKILLFLPENELHELGLLFYNYILRSRNFRTYYLGQQVPVKDLHRIKEIIQPDYIVTIITTDISSVEFSTTITEIANCFPSVPVFISGRPVIENKNPYPSGFCVFKDTEQLISLLK